MLSSILATFDKSSSYDVKNVLDELKQDENIDVKGIVYGELFGKMTASIFVQEVELPLVFEKLVENKIQIFPFDEEYKKKLSNTYSKLYSEDSVGGSERKNSTGYLNLSGKNHYQQIRKNKSNTAETNHKQTQSTFSAPSRNIKEDGVKMEKLSKTGDYIAIRDIIKHSTPNSEVNEQFIAAIKKCIKINLENGLTYNSLVDDSINKLKEILCDEEIKSLAPEEVISTAGTALLSLCREQNPEELINVANHPELGAKINVMAAVKLSELIYRHEKFGEIDENLLRETSRRINSRHLQKNYNIIDPILSDANKMRFNRLLNAVERINMGEA